jgi:hypothetical protein
VLVSGFGVKSEGFGLILASITSTGGADEPILSAFLRNRTRETSRIKKSAPERRRKKSLKNVKGSPGEVRAGVTVDGRTIGTRLAVNLRTDCIVSALTFSRRPQSSFGDARRLEHPPAKARERPLCGREQERGGGWVWRAGIWEDRRPEAPAGGRKRAAAWRRST